MGNRGTLDSASLVREKQSPVSKAYGGVLVDDRQRILLCKPRGEYGGYAWTFTKGRALAGEMPLETALREVKEETGYDVLVTRKIPGRYKGTTTVTEFYLMQPEGAPNNFESETEEVRWVSVGEAEQMVMESENSVGKLRVRKLLAIVGSLLREALTLAKSGQD